MPVPVIGGIATWVVAALVGGFGQSIIQGVTKLLIALGFGFLTYQGIDAMMDYILDAIGNNMTSIHPTLLGMFGYMQIDKCLNVIASAYTARFLIQGLTGGIMRKFGITR